ncbi:protein farnesyltransferase/geranylgeranyltransferase type I alpha subunit [Marssonina coronariae]|uniref:Protein farnesyltransferase/geranylgeranyltransferase type-1 subunit alpha n=1 Tax=Diplocarpon coronariae TaxID=2795749 RepID=A0A218ZEU5_9HELO|nr:protein farnesyltransferase/geranylgeranyltransferase type I alpha subunit [Marssonina coronariae]
MTPPDTSAPRPREKACGSATEHLTIAAELEAEYLASRPYQVRRDSEGFTQLAARDKQRYAHAVLLETGAWQTWARPQQEDFWRLVGQQQIPIPLPKPRSLGQDGRGSALGSYTPAAYRLWERRERASRAVREASDEFRSRRVAGEGAAAGEVEEERARRRLLGNLRGRKMGLYEGDPDWDDVEHSPRVLRLTEHIISLNAAHYTVWLYRASTLFALGRPVEEELQWVNGVALENQKNYQIWHHRQLLIDHLYPTMAADAAALQALAESEIAFLTRMLAEDSKNYHVWSYRQYLVRKLDLFRPTELASIETLLRQDVRNNSAWSHRFFVVFSDPAYCTAGCPATQADPRVPDAIIEREMEFSKAAAFEAPQNPSAWNYLRGVLRKGNRRLRSQECFAGEFAKIPAEGAEEVKSSHALDFLADVWSEMGEVAKADRALVLLGDKYDQIRKNYWEWRRSLLARNAVGGGDDEVGGGGDDEGDETDDGRVRGLARGGRGAGR